MTYRLLEHTADMGLEAQGGSLEQLFSEAAQALREVLFGQAGGRIEQTIHLRVTGQDVGELLVNWLNEILYIFEVRGFYPVSFLVETITDHSVCGLARGEPFDLERHPVERVVKAVTYHQLLVEQVEGQWRARVYVDL
jgi:SHS2 domain-containing protein